ncbi:PEP-CTERM protein-sorting domain-containing protein/choice-of-anchor A domain-containing protein [Sphingomonas laterariae]|uniref:PEP-CTERM protein-sorting domain-containing protein/choice-of-anchor A domain-containing protein n=1 Tax=Edaphosphingomonas laterariae TaxID=861865 RepID=A0A239F663_9SPHN|nr:choice-of-anchor A family protein [Sphingomonas laterariae]SNS52295.1 PEP-CTERM protein-sorting domain-containing protein/choice-of-anchor A domain-containing protein [Sphingomonas laterariae]
MALTVIRRAAMVACAATAMIGATAAQAALVDLTGYNAFVLGSYTGFNSDVEGRLAAGGSVSLTNYAVGSALGSAANGTNSLIAGGGLAATNGQLFNGNAVVAGGSSLTSFNIANGTLSNGPSPIDFTAQGVSINALADQLGTLGVNGSTVAQWGGVTLTGAQSGLNIFTLDASVLSGANNFTIIAPTGSQVLVNVTGGAASLQNMGFNLNGVAASNVLLNFYEAGSLSMNGIGIHGSVLAPGAAVNFNNGQLNGLLVAGSFYGSGELHNKGYTGGLLTSNTAPVPEPASWAMMIAGFGLIGTAIRRARFTERTIFV